MTTYERICREECEWCAKGIPIDIQRKRRNEDGMGEDRSYVAGGIPPEPPQHITGYTDYSSFNVPNKWVPCTAPSKDEVIERLASVLTSIRQIPVDAKNPGSGNAGERYYWNLACRYIGERITDATSILTETVAPANWLPGTKALPFTERDLIAPAHPDSVRLIPISDDWRGDLAHQIATIMDGEFHDGYDSLMALTVATRIIAETQRAIDKAMAAASIGKSDDERRICIHKPEVLTADGTVICKRCGERIRLAWGDTWILDESVTRPTTERTR